MLEPKGGVKIVGTFVAKCPICAHATGFKRRVQKVGICWCSAFKMQLDSTVFGCMEFERASDEMIEARIVQLNERGYYGTPPGGWEDETGEHKEGT